MGTEKILCLRIFTRDELETALNALAEIIDDIYAIYANVKREMKMIADRVVDAVHYTNYPTIEKLKNRVDRVREKLDEFIQKLVDDLIIRTLNLDDDLTTWEDVFDAAFDDSYRRLLGLAVLEENGELTPVIITTEDYREFFIEPVDEYQ